MIGNYSESLRLPTWPLKQEAMVPRIRVYEVRKSGVAAQK
jgi:hypothetical protein